MTDDIYDDTADLIFDDNTLLKVGRRRAGASKVSISKQFATVSLEERRDSVDSAGSRTDSLDKSDTCIDLSRNRGTSMSSMSSFLSDTRITLDSVQRPIDDFLEPAKLLFTNLINNNQVIKKRDFIQKLREMGADRRRGCLSVLSALDVVDDVTTHVNPDIFSIFMYRIVCLIFASADTGLDGLLSTSELKVIAIAITNGEEAPVTDLLHTVETRFRGVVDARDLFTIVTVQILNTFLASGSAMALFGLCSLAHINNALHTQTEYKELYVRCRDKELSGNEIRALWALAVDRKRHALGQILLPLGGKLFP